MNRVEADIPIWGTEIYVEASSSKLSEDQIKNEIAKVHDFYIEVDNVNPNALWVFANSGGLLGDYVVRFQFEWESNQYHIRKCVIGEGSAGENIQTYLTLPITKAKTVGTFVSFIKENVGMEIIKDTFKN